jgi:hypothetical protein
MNHTKEEEGRKTTTHPSNPIYPVKKISVAVFSYGLRRLTRFENIRYSCADVDSGHADYFLPPFFLGLGSGNCLMALAKSLPA